MVAFKVFKLNFKIQSGSTESKLALELVFVDLDRNHLLYSQLLWIETVEIAKPKLSSLF